MEASPRDGTEQGAPALPTTSSMRPQTSHGGRPGARKAHNPRGEGLNGIQRREEKHAGLGDTSKNMWDEDTETDVSRKQILQEKKQAILE